MCCSCGSTRCRFRCLKCSGALLITIGMFYAAAGVVFNFFDFLVIFTTGHALIWGGAAVSYPNWLNRIGQTFQCGSLSGHTIQMFSICFAFSLPTDFYGWCSINFYCKENERRWLGKINLFCNVLYNIIVILTNHNSEFSVRTGHEF